MVTTTRAGLTRRVRQRPDTLAVTGTVPPELDGCLLRTVRHPVASAPLLDSGIQLRGGLARWYRRGAAPHGPATAWRAAHMWSGGQSQDEIGSAAVARPVADPVTRLWHTVATYPGLGHAEHLWLGPDGAVRDAEPFAMDGAPLMHAVSATARYLVVFDLPVTHRRAAALLGARFPYAWQEGRPARVGLLGRHDDRPRWFEVRPCYVFNAVNAYDDGDRVVIDVVRHERAFDRAAGRQRPPALWRWTIDLRRGTVDERPLADVSQESAEVDPRVRGRRHRYAFSADRSTNSLLRHDLVDGATRIRGLGTGRSPETPVFVPRPGSAIEGDGWLLTVVHDLAGGRSDLLILDAQDLCGAPVATVALPVRLPPSLYTHWQPNG